MNKKQIEYDLIKEKYLAKGRLITKIFVVMGSIVIPTIILLKDELRNILLDVIKPILNLFTGVLGTIFGSLLFFILLIPIFILTIMFSYIIGMGITKVIVEEHDKDLKKFEKEVKNKILNGKSTKR